jgi:hypothetical protein
MNHAVRRAATRPFGRRAASAVAVVLACAGAPAAAQAGNPITRLAAGPIAASTHCNPNLTASQFVTTAGARTDYCMAYYVDGGDPASGDDTARTIVDNPEGFLATADSNPQCALVDYQPSRGEPARCPANTQTGSGQALVRVQLAPGLVINQTVPVKMWNLEHAADSVAGVGIELAPNLDGIELSHTKLVSYVSLRPNPNVGLRTTIEGMPRVTDLGGAKVPIALDGFFLRFWGSKDDHPTLPASFALHGSDCTTDQVTTITTESYSGDTQGAQAKYRLTDCEHVPFGITATLETSERRPDVPTATKVTVQLDQHFDPRVTSNIKSTTLTMPQGLELGAQVASGVPLALCSAAQFAWASSAPVECPAASRVADVDIVSPLQASPFKGAGYLGEQTAPGQLPQVFIVGEFSGAVNAPRVKLRGRLSIDAQGRLKTTLVDLPQVLFERFTLTFRGGDHAPMQTPRQCGTTHGEIVTQPSNGQAPVVQSLPLTIDQDCIDPAAFTPTMAITSTNLLAGGRGVTSVTIARPDRQARFAKLLVNLPQGILSDLQLATECSLAAADAGQCPASSRIGTVTALSGVGPQPYPVQGDVFLRARDEGAVANLLIATPVKFGPVDLGRLLLPARIELRPGDLGLRLTTEVPQRFEGLPLSLRSFRVDLDRENFAMNPTSCAPLAATSMFTSDAGGAAPVTSTFQVGGCERLAFEPTIGFALSGQMGVNQKPTLDVTVQLPAGGANIRTTSVTMPDGLAADLTQVARACRQADWDGGTCPQSARIGTVEGRLAITDEVLSGTLSMVKIDGRTLPSIGIAFQGRFASRLLGAIAIDRTSGQLVTTFADLPDVPLTRLALHLEGGPAAPLFSTAALCQRTPTMVGVFTGQSGAQVRRTAVATCSGVQAARAGVVVATGSLRKGLRLSVSAAAGQQLAVVRMTLPRGVHVLASRRMRSGAIKGARGLTLAGRTVQATIPAAGRSAVTLTFPKGTFGFHGAAGRAPRIGLTVRAGYANGARDVLSVRATR